MANPYKAEIEVKLKGISYKLAVTMNVIAQWQKSTGLDFMNTSGKAVDAYMQSLKIQNPLKKFILLSDAITLDSAAWLFYYAAKETNTQVEFGEIQEAMIDEMDLSSFDETYLAMFASLVMFSMQGPQVESKKKDPSNNGSLKNKKAKTQ